jgi:hypothetical protein
MKVAGNEELRGGKARAGERRWRERSEGAKWDGDSFTASSTRR